MGLNDRIDDEDGIVNLPPDAFGQFDGPIDQDDHWLLTAERKDQLVVMRAWFMARYCDPANVLPKRFSGIVDDEAIQEVIDEIHSELGNLYAPERNANVSE